MAEDAEKTLNAADDVDGPGGSSPPDGPGDQDITEISTMDQDEAVASAETLITEKGEEEGTPEKEEKEAGADEGKAGEKDEQGQTVPYDRFQEVITEKNAALERAVKAETERDAATVTTPKEEEKDFKDITEMSKEDLIDQFNEDPKAFLSNFGKQIRDEVIAEVTAKTTEEKADADALSTYNQYAKDNPDFDEMWKRGEIQTYMEQNPGHNAISAHMTLTGEKKTQEKVDAAKKQTEKDVIARVKSKKGASVLGEGPSGTEVHDETVDSELKDSKKHGGLASLLTKRLERSRQKAAG